MDLADSKTVVVDPIQKQFYLVEDSTLQVSVNPDHPIIIGNSQLSPNEQSYCSCVAQVASEQPAQCNLEKVRNERRQ